MQPQEQEHFRNMLREQLDELLAKAGSAIGDLTDQREALSDAVDIAAEESQREFRLREQELDRVKIRQIREALQRVNQGEYGECISCGDYISQRRLEVRPMTTLCIDCATEREVRRH